MHDFRNRYTRAGARRGAVILALALTLVAFGSAGRTQAGAAPRAGLGDFAGLVDIGGGRRLYLECRGAGGPTVILEAGYRSPATVRFSNRSW